MSGVRWLSDQDVGLKSTGYRSQAAVTPEGLVFISGQIGSDPVSKELVSPRMGEQATQCLHNVEQVVKAAGGDRHDIVQLHVFITDTDLYPEFNEATREFFGDNPPTRSVIGSPFLAASALVEISGIAYLRRGK